ncbi:(3R)-2'-hydroxyisoflavanone reductase [Ranunculus cassubicifolius]
MKSVHLVHIDDVASAQIFLFESPKSEGRYMCSTVDVTIQEVAKLLSVKYSEHLIPTEFLSKMEKGIPDQLSSKKLVDLGFKFSYGVDEMIDGALQCCKDKGFLSVSLGQFAE